MKKYISVAQMGDLMGISRIAVFKKIKKGYLKAEQFGKAYLIEGEYAKQYAEEYNHSKGLSQKRKEAIKKAVEKITAEYSETFKLLGKN